MKEVQVIYGDPDNLEIHGTSLVPKGMELVTTVIDPEIRKFNDWFQDPKRGDGPLTKLERELLRSYLYQKLTGVL